MEKIRSPHKLKRTLIKDKKAYVETVGKEDMTALQEVLGQSGDKGTVVRLFLGATTSMPLRALSYVASAARVARNIPCDQLQVISVNKLGERINAIPLAESQQQSQILAALGSILVRGFMPEVADKTVFAEEAHIEDVERFVPLAKTVLQEAPALTQSLRDKGAKHGGDYVTYSAAHLVNQDTALLELDPISGTAPVNDVQRIVAVGCQQERTFYDLRMGMRSLVDASELIPAVQVFTHHVSPPYYTARHGEQSLEDALINGVNLDAIEDTAAARDMKHFVKSLGDM